MQSQPQVEIKKPGTGARRRLGLEYGGRACYLEISRAGIPLASCVMQVPRALSRALRYLTALGQVRVGHRLTGRCCARGVGEKRTLRWG